MRVRFDRSFGNSLLFFLTFLVAMQLKVSRTILMIALCLLFAYIAHRTKEPGHSMDMVQIQRLCLLNMGLLFFFVLMQIFVLGMDVREIALDVATVSCVYIGYMAGALSMRAFDSFETYLRGLLMFIIGFSSVYIIDILLNGMPEGRNSVFNNVSSNFCSAVLFLNYPIILYYLFARRGVRRSWMTAMCYVALLLSMGVILSSGSRTALGCVALILMMLMLFRQNRPRYIKRYIFIVTLGVVGAAAAYTYIPSVREMLSRALDAFGGNATLNSDVRQIIWTAALMQFRSGNQLIGSGSSYVVQFDRSAHNLFYEILLCTGWIGLAFFIITSAVLILLILRAQRHSQRYFTVMLLISALIVALVQPFFSSSYICGMIVWMSMFVLTYDAKGNR